ncbi:MAG: hypothetical protein KAJ39_08320 [Gammaproteobacteria bacterium]|nr:hypothetical protein [Gammaproteobacteria bacterium]
MSFWTHHYARGKQMRLQSIIFVCLYFSAALLSISQAKDLYITDDYLKGLSDEVSSPEYLEKAKQELRETEKREQSQTSTSSETQKALISMYNFETLLRTKYPSSHAVYSKLPVSARVIIFDKFKSTKKLSSAKRIIIEKYESK